MSLKTTEFPIFLLNAFVGDIHGLHNNQTGEVVKRGLKNQPLNQRVKQHLKRLAAKLQDEAKSYEETLEEIRNKYRNEEKLIPDEKKEDFLNEVRELHKTDVEISHHAFTEEDLSIPNCSEDYEILDYILPLVEEVEPEEVKAD